MVFITPLYTQFLEGAVREACEDTPVVSLNGARQMDSLLETFVGMELKKTHRMESKSADALSLADTGASGNGFPIGKAERRGGWN